MLATNAGAWGFHGGDSAWGGRVGWQYPTATEMLDTAVRSGPAGGFHYGRHLSDWFAVGLEAELLNFRRGRGAIVAGQGAPQRMYGGTGALFATGRLNLVFDRPWTIYVKGGGGFHATRAKVVTLAGANNRSHRDFAVLAAGGAEVFTLKNVSLLFEARWESFNLADGKFGMNKAEFLSFQTGLSYWFGQH
ncbi:MAG: outer membrane beta-barrel protein [Elusimicrobia bacterium]|nr:outer membrane beta-barrel protein [Elusimicrobiota bacterium]